MNLQALKESTIEKLRKKRMKSKVEWAALSPEERSYIKHRRMVSLLSLGITLTLFAIIAITAGGPMIDFISRPEEFHAWVDSNSILGVVVMVGIRFVQTLITLIPGEAVEVGAGYGFGAINGLLLCTVGTALGTIVIYMLTKKFGVKLVEAFISREKINSFGFIRNSSRLNLLVFILFLIPGTPKDLILYFIGLTPMKLGRFLALSSIARIPAIITSTIAGEALGQQNYFLAILIFAITGAVGILGIIAYVLVTKKQKEQEKLLLNGQEA